MGRGELVISIDSNKWGIRSRTIWLNDRPYDVDDVDCVSFCACDESVDVDGFKREDRSTIIIDLTKDPDIILKDMNSKCRSDIKKAEKEGIEVVVDREHEAFYDMNRHFRSMKGLDSNEFSTEFMKRHCTLLMSKMGETPISGILLIADDRKMRGLIAASQRLDSGSGVANMVAKANRLLWWKAIELGQSKGLSVLDMGGYYTGSDRNPQLEGINEFKRRFGGTVVADYFYTKDYSIKVKLAKYLASSLKRIRR